MVALRAAAAGISINLKFLLFPTSFMPNRTWYPKQTLFSGCGYHLMIPKLYFEFETFQMLSHVQNSQ